MGLFKKLKKAFKKVTGFVKKTVKKVVKGVKKVAKKIGSSKILKALAIAAAVVVTGGAALTAFGGTGALASSQFGSWMMSTSQSVLGGKAFGAAAAMKPGVGKFLTQTGNFLAKTAAKPFGAVGGALGSTARVGANILTGAEGGAFAPGQAGAGTGITAPKPFSKEALSGQMSKSSEQLLNEAMDRNLNSFDGSNYKEIEPGVFEFRDVNNNIIETVNTTSTPKTSFFDTTAGKVVSNVGTNVLTGAAMQAIQGEPELRGSMSGAAYEGAEFMDPLKVYAAQQGISTDSIYQHMMYGNADPSSMYGNELYRQQTVGIA
jgi:hypothetical protein